MASRGLEHRAGRRASGTGATFQRRTLKTQKEAENAETSTATATILMGIAATGSARQDAHRVFPIARPIRVIRVHPRNLLHPFVDAIQGTWQPSGAMQDVPRRATSWTFMPFILAGFSRAASGTAPPDRPRRTRSSDAPRGSPCCRAAHPTPSRRSPSIAPTPRRR